MLSSVPWHEQHLLSSVFTRELLGKHSMFGFVTLDKDCHVKGKSAVIHAGDVEERLVGVASLSSSLGCLFEEPVFFIMTESYLDWINDHTHK